MAKPRLAYLPLYTGDFAAATRGWPCCARLLYRELLDAQWDMGGLPNDAERLRAIVNVETACFERGWSYVQPKFVAGTDGLLRNKRLEEHRERAQDISSKRRSAGRAGAAQRWRGE